VIINRVGQAVEFPHVGGVCAPGIFGAKFRLNSFTESENPVSEFGRAMDLVNLEG
jgi:hypothetical protein